MVKELLLGNEAFARGAYEAGVEVAAAYPGTPSTEIMEALAKYPEVYTEWSVNEKVAYEVAYGASLGGKRALSSMKHVGLNVAADPFITSAYTGVNAGLVSIVADDPGMHSSQNEQDSRYYARLAKVPLLEPSDPEECRKLTKIAFDISERFDIPVLVRSTTRLSHSRSPVSIEERKEVPKRSYQRSFEKYVMIPAYARKRHQVLQKKLLEISSFSESFPYNFIEWGEKELGIISSGVAYFYAKEVFPKASFLKLTLTYPLPKKLIEEFFAQVKKVYVVEEGDSILEREVKALGFKVIGREALPSTGELNPDIIREGLLKEKRKTFYFYPGEIPKRPPLFCPGCPHRGVFHTLKKLGLKVFGDIGCYTLGVLPPFEAMDTCLCMGSGISILHGFLKAGEKKAVAVIGDSTFFHAGLPALLNLSYNLTSSVVIVLDNRTTAMTGGQEHPGTGKTLKGKDVKEASLVEIGKALGADFVFTFDPYNLKKTVKVIEEAVERDSLSLLVSRRPCVLKERKTEAVFFIDEEICDGCEVCFELGCPAIQRAEKPFIDETLCTGCTLCLQICPKKAVKKR
jgi:indolepyruvate ferredoxin oxidoreductase alpha subunit